MFDDGDDDDDGGDGTAAPRQLELRPNVSLWMWQHYHSERYGKSFPMSFMAMRASLWRIVTALLWDGMTKKSSHWMNDQILLTRSILRLKLCSVKNRGFWREADLTYDANKFDDGGRCFKGTEEWRHGAAGRWRWVHMTPGHNSTDVVEIADLVRSWHREGGEDKFGSEHVSFQRELSRLWETNKKITAVALPRSP